MHPDLYLTAFTQRQRELERAAQHRRVALERTPGETRRAVVPRLADAASRVAAWVTAARVAASRREAWSRAGSEECCVAA